MKDKFLTICDVLFVLVLCFAILLVSMLLTKGSSQEPAGGTYTVSPVHLAAVLVSMAVYFGYMLKRSLKWLNSYMQNHNYGEDRTIPEEDCEHVDNNL